MPYQSLKDINPALKGIRPKITLEQANDIADQADAIGADKGGWGIAIKQFKKTHTVRGGKWVKREETKKEMDKPNPIETQAVAESMPDVAMTMDVISFAQLQQRAIETETAESLQQAADMYKMMLDNILYNTAVIEKMAAIETLTAEFLGIMRGYLSPAGQPMPIEAKGAEAEPEPPELELAELAESEEGIITGFAEADEGAKSELAYLNVALIKPGCGNTRDNNYYPRDMLARDAERFIGAKMYETDHREDEKSTRTWVSTITGIGGFTEDGAPIARVAVHDPDFAARIRNLNAAGLLDKMECSILASGRAKAGYEDGGRKGKRVEEIIEVSSVDWVTRAGAGGHAMSLAESDAKPDAETEPVQEVVQETEPVTVEETKKPAVEEKAASLSAEVVTTMLAESRLPEISQKRLRASGYTSEEELRAAIKQETEYVKELTNAGRPFALGESRKQPEAGRKQGSPDSVIEKYFYRK